MMSNASSSLLVERQGELIIVTLNRPDRRNALNTDMMAEMLSFFEARRRDASCRVIILRGAGRHFCVGGDLLASRDGDNLFEVAKQGDWELGDIIRAMRACPQPIIGLANGAVAGGGLALLLATDVLIAGSSASFSTAFIRVGLSGAELGVSWKLQRTLGISLARELIYTSDALCAEDALAGGLVSRVVPSDELDNAGLVLAKKMLASAQDALRLTKRSLDAALETPSLSVIMELEERAQVLCLTRSQHEEPIAHFRKGWDVAKEKS